jgi:hypothetical protein
VSRHGSEFARIDPIERSDRPDDERVGIAIEIMGLKSAPQIAVWGAEELEADIKADARLRAGIVDALQDFLNRVAGVQ